MRKALHVLTPAQLAVGFGNPDWVIGALRLAEVQWLDGLGKGGSAAEWMGLTPEQYDRWRGGGDERLALAQELCNRKSGRCITAEPW